MTPSDSPWWDVMMKFVLAFGALVFVFALVVIIVVVTRMLGAWRDQRRRRKKPFRKQTHWRQ